MNTPLLIATKNAGKAAELAGMFDGLGVSCEPLPADAPDVEETATTFRANALLKATAYARHFGTACLADDSGLQVAALDDAPGIYSARFAAMHDAGEGDAANNTLLLEKLADADDRRARFVCVLALCDVKGRPIFTTEGHVSGTIVREPRGDSGFGYDPLFEHAGKTMAERTAEEKAALSHRGVAAKRLSDLLATFPLS
ncbi:MAG: RdgB/HAM1 family non-canonical purine NTP pyrophosphatase [Planctomycetota bacterium]